jgi:predicted enzyme related to lactoylglutathione lyase
LSGLGAARYDAVVTFRTAAQKTDRDDEGEIVGNAVMQWQIVANDPDALTRFHGSLFGWKTQTNNALGYRQVDTQSAKGINGGVWPSPPEGHDLVQLFVEVDDVAAYVAKAMALGATVIVPKSELPDGDALAIVIDPAGLSFGLYRPRPS